MILRVSSAHLVGGVFKRGFFLLWTEGDEESKAPQGKLRRINKELHKTQFHGRSLYIRPRFLESPCRHYRSVARWKIAASEEKCQGATVKVDDLLVNLHFARRRPDSG